MGHVHLMMLFMQKCSTGWFNKTLVKERLRGSLTSGFFYSLCMYDAQSYNWPSKEKTIVKWHICSIKPPLSTVSECLKWSSVFTPQWSKLSIWIRFRAEEIGFTKYHFFTHHHEQMINYVEFSCVSELWLGGYKKSKALIGWNLLISHHLKNITRWWHCDMWRW